jgi:mycoredoxin
MLLCVPAIPKFDLADRIENMQVTMYSAPWCRDCRAAKRYLDEHGIAYTEIDIEADPAASDEVIQHVGKRAIPQLVLDGEWFQPYKPGRGILYDELDKRFGIHTQL